MNKFYITTPIYYPSGKFHIGTSYTEVLADSLKKYHKLKGEDCFMLTGVDEHGQKIENKAVEAGMQPKEYVDIQAKAAIELWKTMKIDYDKFIRTTDEYHVIAVQKIFERFLKQGDIYKGEYEGWYCEPCESYFTETQLVDGKCPDCGREVKKMKEEAYFFNMKKYADRLIAFYKEHPNFILQESRKNELFNNFLKPGLEDLCVSRTSFEWGVKVKKDPKHVIYVWLDALTNYITALGYLSDDDSLLKKYWPADLHIVGKDIIRFHGIYWPIFLMALDLPLPKQIYAHGFIMMKDGKMSKSKGNVIYPEPLIERYGLDTFKYFILREMSFGQDGTFTPEGFIDRFNFDLCNDLGNLLNRTIGMINKYFNGEIKAYSSNCSSLDKELETFSDGVIHQVEEYFDSYHISNAIAETWNLVARTNKYIDETTPWVLAKEERKEELASVMYHLVENLRRIAILIRPYMNHTSEKILNQLSISIKLQTWDSLKDYDKIRNITVTQKPEVLFARLDPQVELEAIKEMMKV